MDDISDAGANKDDWHSIKDAKQRKRVQDKLAQRARRKRLREAKKNGKQIPQQHEPERNPSMQDDGDFEIISTSEITSEPLSSNPSNSSNLSLCLVDTMVRSSSHTPSLNPYSAKAKPSLSHELPYSLTLSGALFLNGQILGLPCCVVVPSRSSPASPDVPLPLRPTAIQLTTIHSTGIDRFPFPKMRDTVINLASMIDEEELLHDLLVSPSFYITPGCASWDPRAWNIEKPFADKWGFLFQ